MNISYKLWWIFCSLHFLCINVIVGIYSNIFVVLNVETSSMRKIKISPFPKHVSSLLLYYVTASFLPQCPSLAG